MITDEERLARRVRLAERMGWKLVEEEPDSGLSEEENEQIRSWPWLVYSPNGQCGNSAYTFRDVAARNGLPNFDTDPAAREALKKYMFTQGYHFYEGGFKDEHDGSDCADVTCIKEHGRWYSKGEYGEALLSAIDAALSAREVSV